MNSTKQTQRWQRFLIVFVFLMTLYNILPTIIYYSKPLDQPISSSQAEKIAQEFSSRALSASDQTEEWVRAFLEGLKITPKSIKKNTQDPTLLHVEFHQAKDASTCADWIEYAGNTSIFDKSRQPIVLEKDGTTLTLGLKTIMIPDASKAPSQLFTFFQKNDENNPQRLTKEFTSYVGDRYIDFIQVMAKGSFLESEARNIAKAVMSHNTLTEEEKKEYVDPFVLRISSYLSALQASSSSTSRNLESKKNISARVLLSSLYSIRENLRDEVGSKPEESQEKKQGESTLQTVRKSLVSLLQDRLREYEASNSKVSDRLHAAMKEKLQATLQAFSKLEGIEKWNSIERDSRSNLVTWYEDAMAHLQDKKKHKSVDIEDQAIITDLSIRNPLFDRVALDISSNRIELNASQDIQALLEQEEAKDITDLQVFLREELLQQAALVSRASGEEIETVSDSTYAIPLFSTPGAASFLKLSSSELAQEMSQTLLNQVFDFWSPQSADFQEDSYPRVTIDAFAKLPRREDRKMCLLAFSPASTPLSVGHILKPSSLYLILRGGKKIVDSAPSDEAKSQAIQDITALAQILQKRGFISYTGEEVKNSFGATEFLSDIIFELENFYAPYLALTKEQFQVKGRTPILEFSTFENRLRVENTIDDQEQESLVRWKEMWQSAQVAANPQEKILVPHPNRNVFLSNFAKGWKKYFRGDYSKVLHWGLDLSGGKSVKVGLYDSAMRPVTDQKDLHQAVSELYQRLNGMGVSERVIRVENNTISIDFPGSQDISSNELIQASAMYFHIVNEKFGPMNKKLHFHTQRFLQEVWNEALLTNQKDLESINKIAARRLHIARDDERISSESARALVQEGLAIRDPFEADLEAPSSAFDDSFSTIVRYKTDSSYDESALSTHPLLIVFRNYALEGANLDHVSPSYDPMKGNVLSFQVRTKDAVDTSRPNPQDALYAWTSRFCLDSIQGTPLQEFSRGQGWRMAVVLNGSVISDPTLSAAIKDSAYISGHFSQREVQRLARDLQAGSLSYTPRVLSEYNVSPELGKSERDKGIMAACLGILSVIVIMVVYYRFLGVVACVAVLVNILIIWAVMQNIEAAMTLPALAGVVLTVGMAVDANVLVFERIREELRHGAKLVFALQAGYQRAFSAIVDSNLTTLIAAFILTQFDSGPIRGFAITLIIGILSSMFTALFMTRVYFNRWVERKTDKATLSMASWFPESTRYNFFRYTKPVIILSGIVLLLGFASVSTNVRTIFGMDFTGGYALVVEVENDPTQPMSPKEKASLAFEKAGLKAGEYQIRELGEPTLLRIQLSSALDEEGKPFHKDSNTASVDKSTSEENPKITWIVQNLEKEGLVVTEQEKLALPNQWTVMSGQFSNAMRNNAIYALALSLFAILVYIAVRFEWKYAISSVLALLHDVLMTLAVLAICSKFGLNLQINLEVVGAIMTIIGYSLNDTIIVFDRVREERKLHRKMNFQEAVNLALNSTLSRTIMTSSTTLSVLLMLVLFGGPSIFTFSFVMFVGVLLGTISSLYVAAPLLVYFDRQEQEV